MYIKNKRILENGAVGGYIKNDNGKWVWRIIKGPNKNGGGVSVLKKPLSQKPENNNKSNYEGNVKPNYKIRNKVNNESNYGTNNEGNLGNQIRNLTIKNNKIPKRNNPEHVIFNNNGREYRRINYIPNFLKTRDEFKKSPWRKTAHIEYSSLNEHQYVRGIGLKEVIKIIENKTRLGNIKPNEVLYIDLFENIMKNYLKYPNEGTYVKYENIAKVFPNEILSPHTSWWMSKYKEEVMRFYYQLNENVISFVKKNSGLETMYNFLQEPKFNNIKIILLQAYGNTRLQKYYENIGFTYKLDDYNSEIFGDGVYRFGKKEDIIKRIKTILKK